MLACQFNVAARHLLHRIAAVRSVVVRWKQSTLSTAEPSPAEVLYRRGRTSTMCTLVLTGKVFVQAGKDGEDLIQRQYEAVPRRVSFCRDRAVALTVNCAYLLIVSNHVLASFARRPAVCGPLRNTF